MEPDGPELLAAWQAMVRVCEGVLGSRDDAEDCASEALLHAFAEGLDDVENVEAWLVAIAKRRAFDVLRRRVRNRRQLIRLASRCEVSDPDPAERVADEAEARWLSARADELLTAPARAVLSVVADGGSVNDAASRLAMTRRSAESHLHRARLTLRAARVAVPAFVMACLRWSRKPVAATSVALAAVGVAVVAPAYLSPETPQEVAQAPAAPVARPEARVVTWTTSPEKTVAERNAPAVRASRSGPQVAAPVAPAAKRVSVSSLRTSGGGGLDVDREGSVGPSDAVGSVVHCAEQLVVNDSRIGC